MLKEQCLFVMQWDIKGGKVGVRKDALRNRKFILVGLDRRKAAVIQGRGLSDNFEAFIDGTKGHIKMGDLVPADPNCLEMDAVDFHNHRARTRVCWVEILDN